MYGLAVNVFNNHLQYSLYAFDHTAITDPSLNLQSPFVLRLMYARNNTIDRLLTG